jgi:kynurenine 3-monooxygenase
VIYSIDRAKIHAQLLNTLTDRLQSGTLGSVCFDSRLERLDIKTSTLLFHNQQDDTRFNVQAGRIYGCDGAFSKVRSELIKQVPSHLEYAHFEHEYKELVVPAAGKGKYKLDPNWLHIWPRKDFMLIALPNLVHWQANAHFCILTTPPSRTAHSRPLSFTTASRP